MDPAEQLRSVTAHRDALLAEVKTLQRDKHHLRRDVETLRRDLAATSSARDAAVLEAASLRRRLSTAAPRVESPGAPPPPRARPRAPPPPKPISGAAQRRAASNGFGLAAPSSGFGLAPARPPRPAPIAPARKKKKRAQSNMNGLIDGLYLTSVWNDELAADYTRALLDDVWKGNVPPVAALSGALELRAWRLAGPKDQVREWERDNQPCAHPFDSGEDRRTIAARNGRKQARRRHVLDDDAEDAWAQAAQSSEVGSMGLPERSMREARVCLAKWRLAATERPCPLLPDDLFLAHLGPCLDGASLANLQASSRYFWVPRPALGPCATIALAQLGQPQTFYTVAPCERLQRRLDVGARLKVLRARNKFHRALSEWKDEVRRQRAAEKAAAQRAYESAKALLEDIEKAKEACAAAKAALPDNFAPGEVTICVEIKVQATYAIDTMVTPSRHLLDGVEVLRHRRDVIPVTASALTRLTC
jgi:hypothetical protein